MGGKIIYYAVIYPISKLPYRLLYALSDVFFFFLYYVVTYRKGLVRENMKKCFPEKDDKEIKDLSKKFFRHFCDIVVESLKNFNIKEKDAFERMISENEEAANQFHASGRPLVLCGGHYNNWELWAVAAHGHLQHHLLAIYKKLSDKFLDKKLRDSRGKFGMQLVSTREVKQVLESGLDGPVGTVYGFDQSPSDPKKAYWLTFLGRETACFFGPEKYAKMHDAPVIFGRVIRLKRGYYKVQYELVTDSPRETEYGEITKKIFALLEKDILEVPQYWLWTHKRWKHKRPENVEVY